jgi:hypothetical protein
MAAVVTVLSSAGCIAAAKEAAPDAIDVTITERDGKLRVETGGELFTEYCYNNVPRPYFYPVFGPTGDCVIRNWPMMQGKDEATDHQHHRSLWFTHGDVNGHDFWSEKENHPKIVHDEFLEVSDENGTGVIQSTNKWMLPDGEIVCTDTRTHRFYARPEGRMMDFEVTVHASHGKIVFGDTKEGSMAIRLAPTMRLKGDVGQGHIVNSAGDTDKDTWGKRAAWCDYYGPVSGRTVGVAIFEHPSNPKYPTWWHVRDYGLFAANPFGVHYFEEKEEHAGDITVPAGEDFTLKYRFFFHAGDTKTAEVEKVYADYMKETAAK